MPEGGCVHEHTSVAVREQCWEATAEQEKDESAVGFQGAWKTETLCIKQRMMAYHGNHVQYPFFHLLKKNDSSIKSQL